jgi:hypothetical protein
MITDNKYKLITLSVITLSTFTAAVFKTIFNVMVWRIVLWNFVSCFMKSLRNTDPKENALRKCNTIFVCLCMIWSNWLEYFFVEFLISIFCTLVKSLWDWFDWSTNVPLKRIISYFFQKIYFSPVPLKTVILIPLKMGHT